MLSREVLSSALHRLVVLQPHQSYLLGKDRPCWQDRICSPLPLPWQEKHKQSPLHTWHPPVEFWGPLGSCLGAASITCPAPGRYARAKPLQSLLVPSFPDSGLSPTALQPCSHASVSGLLDSSHPSSYTLCQSNATVLRLLCSATTAELPPQR